MGFKSLVIRGLKTLDTNLDTTNATKQFQTMKVDSNHEHLRIGEGVGLSGEPPYHIWIGARKKFWKTGTVTLVIRISLICLVAGFLEVTRVAVPQFVQ